MPETILNTPEWGHRTAGASETMRPPFSGAGDEPGNENACRHPFAVYADDPAGFAEDVLGSTWWAAQKEIAELVATNRRVAVKAANGVGKTYLAADIVLWFLYCHCPSVVLTTAPTWRQVESLLWEEVRRRHHAVNARAESDPALPKLEGSLLQTRLRIAEGHFAMGLSTDEPVRFQGFHAENLLVVLDEACGVPEEIWDAVEGVCVGGNNRVLAISNPLTPVGRFAQLFKSARWKTYTISALAHPNVTRPGILAARLLENGGTGDRMGDSDAPASGGTVLPELPGLIPGAVTREAVVDRIADWCEETPPEESDADAFEWESRHYRPNGLFRARVLGEFPLSADDSLFHLPWIAKAMERAAGLHRVGSASGADPTADRLPGDKRTETDAAGPSASGYADLCVLAVDVARYGADETVFAIRRGNAVTRIVGAHGLSTMEVAGRTIAMAAEERVDLVTIDVVGVGAGVVDRLVELEFDGLVPANFGSKPYSTRDADHFLNLRAQTYWTLRERLRTEAVLLPKDDLLSAQMAGLRYEYTSMGQIQIESKDDIRRRGLSSPDRADAVAMLFNPALEAGRSPVCAIPQTHGAAEEIRAEPVHWNEVSVW